MAELTQSEIDQRVFDLYDEYCHGRIDRREFLQRAGVLTVGGGSALAMAEALLPRYALAQTISFTDQRIKAKDRKSTRLNSSHVASSYAVFCLRKQSSVLRNR